MRTYTIELRCSFESDDKYEAMLDLSRQTARDLLATAILLKDKRDPQIKFQSGDMMMKDDVLEVITAADIDRFNAGIDGPKPDEAPTEGENWGDENAPNFG